jgi:hypothetical protein
VPRIRCAANPSLCEYSNPLQLHHCLHCPRFPDSEAMHSLSFREPRKHNWQSLNDQWSISQDSNHLGNRFIALRSVSAIMLDTRSHLAECERSMELWLGFESVESACCESETISLH